MADSLRKRGGLIAQAVAPLLDQPDSLSGIALKEQLAKLADDGTILKLMFRPEARAGTGAFHVIASAPSLLPDQTGPGLDHVFERHYSYRPAKEEFSDSAPTHAGLGLWIVQRYAEALGGRVTASNRPAGGLCVTIILPGNV